MPAEQTSETREIGSVYDWVSDTARENPALVVGGAVAVGALAAIVLLNRRPQSRARTLEKRIGRELRSMERALSSRRPISTMSDQLADASGALASGLKSWDMEALRGLFSRVGELSSRFARDRAWH
jgi:hypothetical protein